MAKLTPGRAARKGIRYIRVRKSDPRLCGTACRSQAVVFGNRHG
jgi:hypothetical protein